MKTTAIIIFALTYILLLSFPKIRAYIALASADLFVILGILPFDQIITAIDWNNMVYLELEVIQGLNPIFYCSINHVTYNIGFCLD